MARYGLKHYETFHIGIASPSERDGEVVLLAVLKGPLHPVRLQESLNRALLKHPALRARLIRSSEREDSEAEWEVSEDGQVSFRTAVVDTVKVDGEASLFSEPLDPSAGLGVRASLLQRAPNEHTLRLDFHPSLADAPAALRYFDDVMAAYAFEHGAERQVDDGAFANRGMELAGRRHLVLILSWIVRGLFRAVESLWASSRRQKLESRRAERANGAGPYGAVRMFQLTQDQTETLDTVARRAGGSLLDVVLRDVALAFKATKDQGAIPWDFDILVERNQRLGTAAREPEGQQSSLSWLRLSPHALRDRGAALRSVIGRYAYLGDDPLSPGELSLMRRVRHTVSKKLGPMAPALAFPVVFADAGVAFAASFLPRDQDGAVVARGVKVESVSVLPPSWQVGAWSVGVVYYRKALRFAVRSHPQVDALGAPAMVMDHLEELVYETASEPGRETLALDALIEAHARISQGLGPLRSLPIGKHVSPQPIRLRDPRVPSAPAAELPSAGDMSPGTEARTTPIDRLS